jgi:hypothetical protein
MLDSGVDNLDDYMSSNSGGVLNSNSTSSSQLASAGDVNSQNNDSDKVIVYMGDGWCTFPDLDNFDSEKLLKALTLKVISLTFGVNKKTIF